MKTILSSQTVDKNINLTLKGFTSIEKGPRGNSAEGLQSHQCRAESPWKEEAPGWQMVGEQPSHVQNTFKGVTLGFCHKMRSVYDHFLSSVIVQENGSLVEIWTFLGEKYICGVQMRTGVACSVSQAQDELILKGNYIELVSNSLALICQAITLKNKDIRKF